MSENKKTTIKEITEQAKVELKSLTGFDAVSVVSIKKDGEDWVVAVEMLEKKGIPDRMDILGFYEVKMDSVGDLSSYARKSLRKRGDTGEEIQEEES
ncbi:MAG: gas vesicle protein GvpO [bacterium]